ncbi:hypothetical protein EV178_001030 [Coemansia sp. RSA 1646]|nr:hypothetical protein EV178_001030 [Coemansia sp. RSA 1646]KAJ2215812.1 hypothetical protein EV179_001832 [Coemansia sp. RSA 487]
MNASQGFIGGFGSSGPKRQNTDPNAFRSHPNFQTPSQQLPPYQTIGRPDEKEALKPVGESASYDNLPTPSETAFEKPAADIDMNKAPDAMESHKVATGEGSGGGRHHGNGDRDRGLMDFFYKKPDPTYSGLYGTDYEPQISKTKVAVATVAMAAVAYGFSRYRRGKREDNQNRKYEKYTRSGERRRRRHNQSQSTAPTQYGDESTYDGQHHRY